MSLLKVSLICSTAVAVASLSSCGYDITKSTPTFLDTKRGHGRVYAAKKITPESCGSPDYLYFDTKKRIPIEDMNGYVCLPVDQAQDILKHYDEYIYRKANCPQELKPRDFRY